MPKTRSAVEKAAERFIDKECLQCPDPCDGGINYYDICRGDSLAALRRAVLAARKARAKKGATK